MIVGIGIDMIETSRIGGKIEKNPAFMEKVFSKREQEYCDRQASPAQHYAARFAAKEAFLKATGEGLKLGYDLYEIEIVSDGQNPPTISLLGKTGEYARLQNWKSIHVSISHLKDIASAIVIIEK